MTIVRLLGKSLRRNPTQSNFHKRSRNIVSGNYIIIAIVKLMFLSILVVLSCNPVGAFLCQYHTPVKLRGNMIACVTTKIEEGENVKLISSYLLQILVSSCQIHRNYQKTISSYSRILHNVFQIHSDMYNANTR